MELNSGEKLGSWGAMSTVLEIESAIRQLPHEEFWKLAEWFDEAKSEAWDRQIEADALSGKLDKLWEEAELEIAAGKTQPLDEFLADR